MRVVRAESLTIGEIFVEGAQYASTFFWSHVSAHDRDQEKTKMQSSHFFGGRIQSTLQPQYFFHFPIPDAVHAFVQIDRRVTVVHPDLDDVANLEGRD